MSSQAAQDLLGSELMHSGLKFHVCYLLAMLILVKCIFFLIYKKKIIYNKFSMCDFDHMSYDMPGTRSGM